MTRVFDPIEEKEQLERGAIGLERIIRRAREVLADPSSPLWGWCDTTFVQMVYGYFCGADWQMLQETQAAIAATARASIEREQWRAFRMKLDKPRALVLFGPIETHMDVEENPIRWITPNLVLLRDHWLRTGQIDHERVAQMWSKQMVLPAAQGVLATDNILPLSAWDQIREIQNLPEPNGAKRKGDAGNAIALALAEDPAQLHDPKSPVRKKARTYMLRRMANVWLAGGHATTAMNWLQTFEWREGQSGLSPEEVMLRAYAYMPDIEPPPHIAATVAQLRKLPA